MISKDFTYAVVGASNDENKYGYKVFKDLLDNGYKAIPININGKTILGKGSFRNLSEVDERIDVVITVVKPEVTRKIVKEANKIGVKNIWMQPGSEDQKAIEYCQSKGISCISNACIMVQRDKIDTKVN